MDSTELPSAAPLASPRPAGETVRGLGWSAVNTVSRQFLLFASQIALARILLPRDFGVLGMALVLGNLAGVFVDSGYGAALIQRPALEERHVRTAFAVSLVTGIVIGAALAGASAWLADFYREPRVRSVAIVIAVSYISTSTATVWDALAYRHLRFRLLTIVDIASTLIGGIVGVGCAAAGMGAISLALQVLAFSLARLVLLVATVSWRPSLRADVKSFRELSSFSLAFLGFNVLNFGARSGDNVLVGRYLGSDALGYYARAYNLMLMPATTVVSVVSRVMFPSLSRIDDSDHVRRIYLESLGVISLFAAPLSLGMLVSARELVSAVFGPRWLAAVPLIRILAVVSLAQVFQTTTGWIFASRGRTDLQLRWGVVAVPVILAGFVIGIMFGSVEAVAWSYFVTTVVVLGYPCFAYAGRVIDMTVSDVIRSISGPILCAALMAVTVLALRIVLLNQLGPTLLLVVEVVAGGALYGTLVRVLKLSSLHAITSRIPPSLAIRGVELRKLLGAR
jgi:O-antigen/teichoic acid export membrane protein